MSRKVAIRSTVEPVSDTDKAYARMTTRIQVATAIWTMWDRLRNERGVDQQWLADRMGKNKSWVSRLLKGPGNWTLDTAGDLLAAMEGRLTLVEAHTYEEIEQGDVPRTSRKGVPHRIIGKDAEYIVIDDSEWSDLDELNWPLPRSGSALRLIIEDLERE